MLPFDERSENTEIDYMKPKGIRFLKNDEKKKKAGEAAEKATVEVLKNGLKNAIIINDFYTELDTFNSKIGMYPTMQIDHMVITDKALYVIETKHFAKDAKLTGGSRTKSWKYQKIGEKGWHIQGNALKQNEKHFEFITQVLRQKELFDIPIFSIVNLVEIEEKNIFLYVVFQDNIVVLNELVKK